MTKRFRAVIVAEFEASRVKDASSEITSSLSSLRRELPDPGSATKRPAVELQSVEKVTTSTEVVERTVEVTEERVDEESQE